MKRQLCKHCMTIVVSRSNCISKAEWAIAYGYCNNMDVLDVAKEIFGHACAAYYGVAAKAVVTSNAALLGGRC